MAYLALAASLVAAFFMLLRARDEKPGLKRLLLMGPVMVAGGLVPLYVPLNQIILRAFAAGQFAWWMQFKIIAWSCNRGPLVSVASGGLHKFLMVLLLPFSPKPARKTHGSDRVGCVVRYRGSVPITSSRPPPRR